MTDRVIALDIGNVCLRLNHPACFSYFGVSPAQLLPPEFVQAIGALETGQMTETEWLRVFRRVTGGRFSDAEMIYGWNLIVGDSIPGMAEILQ